MIKFFSYSFSQYNSEIYFESCYVKTCVPEIFNQNNKNSFQLLIWKDDQTIINVDYPIILTEIFKVENNQIWMFFLLYYEASSFDFIIYLLSTTKSAVH